MDYRIKYRVELTNEPTVNSHEGIVKNCTDADHAKRKLEAILKRNFGNFKMLVVYNIQPDTRGGIMEFLRGFGLNTK